MFILLILYFLFFAMQLFFNAVGQVRILHSNWLDMLLVDKTEDKIFMSETGQYWYGTMVLLRWGGLEIWGSICYRYMFMGS